MIFTVTPNPAVDITLFLDGLNPHDTNRVQRRETDAGGKGINLARVAAELGADASATGFLGGPAAGQILKICKDQGVGDCFVEVSSETRMNLSVEDGSGKPPTTFNSRGGEISGLAWRKLVGVVRERAPESGWSSFGGSLPPGVPTNAYQQLGEALNEKGCRWALDADGEAMLHGLKAKPHIIKPNRAEASRLVGREIPDADAALDAAKELRGQLAEGGMVLLSLGAQGAVLATESEGWRADPVEINPNSTIGSGDSLLAGFLVGLQRDQGLEEALKLATACGAATATTDGTEIARRPVIEELLGRATAQRVR